MKRISSLKKKDLTINEIYFISFMIILSFIIITFDIYTEISKNINYISYVNITLNLSYFLTALYFTINDKINNNVFLLVILFLYIKSILYFIKLVVIKYNEKINKKLSDNILNVMKYISIFNNLISIIITLYFFRVVFFT